jgi:hypothetical protein
LHPTVILLTEFNNPLENRNSNLLSSLMTIVASPCEAVMFSTSQIFAGKHEKIKTKYEDSFTLHP